MIQCIGCQILQKNARLYANHEVLHIVGQNLIHTAGAQYDTACQRYASANQSGAGTAAGDRDLVGRADLHDLGNFFGALHVNCRIGKILSVDRHLVVRVVGIDILTHEEPSFADNSFQLLGNLRGNFVIGCHAIFLLYKSFAKKASNHLIVMIRRFPIVLTDD